MIYQNVELGRSTAAGEEMDMSWLGKLEKAKAAALAPKPDAWLLPLGRVRGKIDFDGLERVTSQKKV